MDLKPQDNIDFDYFFNNLKYLIDNINIKYK